MTDLLGTVLNSFPLSQYEVEPSLWALTETDAVGTEQARDLYLSYQKGFFFYIEYFIDKRNNKKP